MEIWKPVVGYENIYQVSNLGNVKNIEKNTLKKPTLNKAKRFCVLLWTNNKSRTFID